MVAERAGAPGSCQALLTVMRVASLIGGRIGGGDGRLHQSSFEQVGFHFVPTDIGQRVSIDFDTRRKALPALLDHFLID